MKITMNDVSNIIANGDGKFLEKLYNYSNDLDVKDIITTLFAIIVYTANQLDNQPVAKASILAGLDIMLKDKLNNKKKVEEQLQDDEEYWEEDWNTIPNKPVIPREFVTERLPIKKFKLSVKRGG